MASRFFSSRSKALTLTINRALNPSFSSPSQCLNGLNSIDSSLPPPTDRRSAGSPFFSSFSSSKIFPWRPHQVPYGGYTNSIALRSFAEAQSRGMKHLSQSTTTESSFKNSPEAKQVDGKNVISFSPLEGAAISRRASALANESLKIKRSELSQRITFALIPALLLISKNSVTTSLLIFSVYWQIYGFFKEIFLDYVHHEVTQKWVLIYFQLLLLVLAKDTILCFNLV
ncbi:succinate dehydrogenase subunit 4, mitochondrial-like [Phalaenopsis equestris]|uniref:succinate dehydrogenase subunit 4, mitochondrial-like n=1 Tax=Phalaenopsis equestris TaxID=78828 RepID=UPI0009E3DBA9|nr:succinate dehydrogenase subunit 4, mitochondrial-like [Phalaenopsis equestris]